MIKQERNEMYEEDYQLEQQRDFYSSMMNDYNKPSKKKSQKDAYFIFESAICLRISTQHFEHKEIEAKDFRHIQGIRDAYNFISKNHYTTKHSFIWFNQNLKDEWLYWSTDDWVKNEQKGRFILENWIEQNIVKNAIKYYQKPISIPKPIMLAETPKIVVIEPKKEEVEVVVVKIKKEKPVYLPTHKLVVKDGKVDVNSIILALADLVWREPNRKNLYYIDKLDLSELTNDQKDYVKAVFYPNNKNGQIAVLQNNPYWTIEKAGKNIMLVPSRKRDGYYYIDNKNGNAGLVSLTTISTKLNIAKNTVIYRLSNMSLQDLTKMSKQ